MHKFRGLSMDQLQTEKRRRAALLKCKPERPPDKSGLEGSFEPVDITDCTDVAWWVGGKTYRGRLDARAPSEDPKAPDLLRIEVRERGTEEPMTVSVWETDSDLALIQNRERLYGLLEHCEMLWRARPDLRDQIEERRTKLRQARDEGWG
ncbi:MAG: hypothetical protein WD603_01215 [Patescibacteria group bacterium]